MDVALARRAWTVSRAWTVRAKRLPKVRLPTAARAMAHSLDEESPFSPSTMAVALLVEESVLRHRVGGAAVMAGQLGYLLSVMAFPSVSLGVIPFSVDRRMWMIETFSVYDKKQAQVETLTAQVNVTSPSEIEQYLRAFGEFSRLAVYGAEARTLITSAIDALR